MVKFIYLYYYKSLQKKDISAVESSTCNSTNLVLSHDESSASCGIGVANQAATTAIQSKTFTK